jgi:Argininosuccinate lyase
MYQATTHDFSNATELADYLATKGIPFRQAHGIVGELVLKGIQTGKNLQDISMDDFKKISPLIEEDVYEVLKPEVAVERRNSYGGTGFEQVIEQIEKAREELS